MEVRPVRVPAVSAPVGRLRLRRVAAKPVPDHVVVELLRPEHPRERLALDVSLVLREALRRDRPVELVGLAPARREDLVEVPADRRAVLYRRPAEAELHHDAPSRRHRGPVPRRALRADPVRVHRVRAPVHDVFVEGVLHVVHPVRRAEEARHVRVVLREEELRRSLAVEDVSALGGVPCEDARSGASFGAQRGPLLLAVPAPGVPEPERREEVERRGVGSAVVRLDPDEEVVRARLRVLDEDVEVPAALEDAGVPELELGVLPRPAPVLGGELRVRELALRVLVEHPHVRVSRGRVEVVVELLHVLAVVALVPGEAEDPLLQDRVLPVPERERETQDLVPVGDARDPVLVPAVGARAGVVVGQVLPGGSEVGVVLAHRAPGALGEIRPPALPVGRARAGLLEPPLLCRPCHVSSATRIRTPRR